MPVKMFDWVMSKKKTPRKMRAERHAKSQHSAELAKIVPLTASVKGFGRQQRKLDTPKPKVCRRCGGDGSYMAGKILRVCPCGGAS